VTYPSLLDKVGFDDIIWRSYEEHKEIQDIKEIFIQDFKEIFWYSNWIMCGVEKVYRYLPERVRR